MTIVVNKKSDKFFIAICKKGHHTFLMLGVYDQFQVRQVLSRVGKGVTEAALDEITSFWRWLRSYMSLLGGGISSELVDEGVFREHDSIQPISYEAYDITYEQYVDYLRVVEELQTFGNTFECYKPITTNDDNVTLELTTEIKLPGNRNVERIKDHLSRLNVNDTCRHSAIELVEEIRQAPVSNLVPQNYLKALPRQTELLHGKPSEGIPFYVMPAPPTSFPAMDGHKKAMVVKLYHQLERMLFIEPDSKLTTDKFTRLKELYLELTASEQSMSLQDLLTSITSWKNNNLSLLSTLRKQYFWDHFFTRQTATMTCIAEIENELSSKLGAMPLS